MIKSKISLTRGQAAVKCLKREKVKHVFSLIGSATMEIFDSLYQEKEINFIILFSKSKKPINRNLILKNVWNYSPKSDTHTVETHINRLRKKFLEKFRDSNFIKNNDKGYYI